VSEIFFNEVDHKGGKNESPAAGANSILVNNDFIILPMKLQPVFTGVIPAIFLNHPKGFRVFGHFHIAFTLKE
jgi:hypothetical protein